MLRRRPENDILGEFSGFCIKCLQALFYEKSRDFREREGAKKKKKKTRLHRAGFL